MHGMQNNEDIIPVVGGDSVAFVATILGPIPKPPQGLERVTVLDYKTAC